MRDRRDPWKWPLALGLTFLLVLAGPFLLPRSWLEAILSPLDLETPERATPRPWLVLLPPPVVEAAVEVAASRRRPPAEPEPFRDADWWTDSWRVRVGERSAGAVPVAPPDSLELLLALLGVGTELLERADADSLLARRLLLLGRQEDLDLGDLKPLLDALGRSRTYADILARSADLYDLFLEQEIQVTR